MLISRRYIEFYLDLVCTADNVALLYHLAMKAKTVRDAESYASSEVRVANAGVSETSAHFMGITEPLRRKRTCAASDQGSSQGTLLGTGELSG